jgi:hypothetical protein
MSNQHRKFVSYCLAVAPLVCAFCLSTAKAGAQTLFVFHPVADSFVDSSYPTLNFGLEPFLDVSGGALGGSHYRRTFLKFDLRKYKGHISGVSLVLYGQHVAPSALTGGEPDTAWSVLNDSWTQYGITWSNQPALDKPLSTVSVTSKLQYYSWDVSSFVKDRAAAHASGILSFAVTEAVVPGVTEGYDVFGAGPRPVASAVQKPAPELLISP